MELEAVHLYIITSNLFATPAASQRGSFTVYILCDLWDVERSKIMYNSRWKTTACDVETPAREGKLQLAHEQRQGTRSLANHAGSNDEALERLDIVVALERVLLENSDDERLDLRHRHRAT